MSVKTVCLDARATINTGHVYSENSGIRDGTSKEKSLTIDHTNLKGLATPNGDDDKSKSHILCDGRIFAHPGSILLRLPYAENTECKGPKGIHVEPAILILCPYVYTLTLGDYTTHNVPVGAVAGHVSGTNNDETVCGTEKSALTVGCNNSTEVKYHMTTDDRHNVNLVLTKLLSDASVHVDIRKAVTSGDTGESGVDESVTYCEAGVHVIPKNIDAPARTGVSLKDTVEVVKEIASVIEKNTKAPYPDIKEDPH